MSKRKPHNLQARIARSCRSLLASNHVAVVNIDPSGRQGMINYKSLKNIAPGKIGQAVCGIPHRWTIYLSALCLDARGDRYSKSVEVAPDGVYYLIVPTGSDAEATHEWGGYGEELGGASSAWDGQANTDCLASSNREHDHPAAQFCAAFERDGHKDFYLMARREASFIEITVPEVFTQAYHWTSTQRSADYAYTMDFGDGWLYDYDKNVERLARPVRRIYVTS